jgi:hypothetical protein
MPNAINPTGGPNDVLVHPEQTPSRGARHLQDADDNAAAQSTDAAKVTISHQAAFVSDTMRVVNAENVASARSSVSDIGRASELVKTLASQISEQPAVAIGAHALIDPRVALKLLS